MNRVIVIGAGIAGLSTACYMAQAGRRVTVLEKLGEPGGRARQLSQAGFKFDMGPSWYWMPDVFDRFFADFGKKTTDYYTLRRLDPSYEIFWENDSWKIPADYGQLRELFESIEEGAARQLDRFMKDAGKKYQLGMQKLAYKPSHHLFEFASWEVLKAAISMDLFTPISQHIRKYFKNERLQQLLSFPVLFLGAQPEKIPALYSLMNYADYSLGTWYPEGGIYSVVKGMFQLATELGVNFRFNEEVTQILANTNQVTAVVTNHGIIETDVLIGAADYNFIEQQLLEPRHRSYSAEYWNSRTMSPSCLLYYVGINKKVPALQHHSLFFDVPFNQHADEIYQKPQWPTLPMFYVCCPSHTDITVAPEGHENLFILIPIAAGLTGDNEEIRDQYFQQVMDRLETRLGTTIRQHVVYSKSYSVSDFIHDYHAFKGNAYGLANTLRQTAILKPAMKSSKLSNLIYTGQLTVPGPGMPPAIISGKMAATAAAHINLPKKTLLT